MGLPPLSITLLLATGEHMDEVKVIPAAAWGDLSLGCLAETADAGVVVLPLTRRLAALRAKSLLGEWGLSGVARGELLTSSLREEREMSEEVELRRDSE